MAANQALNPASQQWGREVTQRNEANQQALIRTTMDLQNTDRALQDSITRLNAALETVRLQNEYILSLAVQSVQRNTESIGINDNSWTTADALRPSITLRAPTGRVRVIASAFGHNAVLTYSIPGYVDRAAATASYVQQSAQLVLPGGSASMTSQKEWVQVVPDNELFTVTLECKSIGVDAYVASPFLSVQVLPQ